MLRTAVLLILAGALAAAERDLTPQARLLRDEVAVNRGEALDLLQPPGVKMWSEAEPFSGKPAYAELWFPSEQAPAIASVGWNTRFDAASAVAIEAWQDGAWRQVAELPATTDARGIRRAANKWTFSPALTARALRLRIDAIANIDHDVLHLADWQLRGDGDLGQALFAPEALELRCPAEFNTVELPAAVPVVVGLRRAGAASAVRVEVACTTPGGAPSGITDQAWDAELGDPATKTIQLAFPAQGPYAVTVSVRDRSRDVLLARKRLLVGVRDPALAGSGPVPPLEAPGRPIPSFAEQVAKQGTVWGTELSQCTFSLRRTPGADAFRRIKAVGGEQVFSVLTYESFEPLPGVYNLAAFDRLVAQAGATDIGLTVGLWRWDFGGPTQWWLTDELMADRGGKTAGGWNCQFSVFSPRHRQHARRAVEVLVGRYLNSPAVWAWHPHPYGMVDHDGHGIVDGSPAAKAAWARFLEGRHRTLEALNRAHQASYAAWDAVPVPQPLWEGDGVDLAASCRTLDLRPAWIDWLDFYHDGLEGMRREMMATVRRLDPRRGLDGTNASGGIGHADRAFAELVEGQGYSGDQGLNNLNHLRRYVAKRRFGIPLRLEDIAPVTIGRGFDATTIVDRCDWDVFLLAQLGTDHFSYVFPVWDASPFWERVFANPRARTLVKEAQAADIPFRPAGWLHSFLTDIHSGRYHYEGIATQRWWLMGGLSAALSAPGQWLEPYSDGCPAAGFDQLKVLFDDGSRVLPGAMVDRLVAWVAAGGKLVLTGDAGERTVDRPDQRWELLRRLGYGEPERLEQRTQTPAMLVLKKDNPVFRSTVSLPVQNWAPLTVPKDGTLLGTVGDQVGAVLWKHGQGQVVLLAGLPGSITEATVQAMMSNRSKKDAASEALLWSLWGNAERELGGIAGPLLADSAEWAGVPAQFQLDPGFTAALRQRDETRLVYCYNQGPARVPVLRIPLPPGSWQVSAETLESTTDLGRFTAAVAAAPGIALPAVPHHRFLAVRLTPAP
jgi:hypothetical protein